MKKPLKIYILAYPDNQVGVDFLNAFLETDVPVAGVIVEDGAGGGGIKRLKKKIATDGLLRTIHRLIQVYSMKLLNKNIVGLAAKNNIPVHHVQKFNSRRSEAILKELDIDLFVIASAPILKNYIFTQAKKGCVNTHPGWLPKYRGLGATAYALKNNDSPGVTVHYIDDGIDTGPIIAREKVPVLHRDTIAKINDRAIAQGARLLVKVVKDIQNSTVKLADIDEPVGKNYGAMPYREAKKINRKLRKRGVQNAV